MNMSTATSMGAPFTLKVEHLTRLWRSNAFTVPSDRMVFFALRGCLPVDENNHAFRTEHGVTLAELDYRHPRCTLGQFKDGKMALFPGSTVPNRDHVEESLHTNGVGTNQMMPGYFLDYEKGIHKAGTTTAHEAFRESAPRPIRRTGDDADYDAADRVEFVNPYDNLHAAWCGSTSDGKYGSAGCQVIVGYPKCATRSADSGPWSVFKKNAYALAQSSFPYVLLTGSNAYQVTRTPVGSLPAFLRYGSKGSLVSTLQKALHDKGYYKGPLDGDFGNMTNTAVLAFQTAIFGPKGDDGIVGPATASALKLSWPSF
jgi:putative peptidoglycan binding protein